MEVPIAKISSFLDTQFPVKKKEIEKKKKKASYCLARAASREMCERDERSGVKFDIETKYLRGGQNWLSVQFSILTNSNHLQLDSDRLFMRYSAPNFFQMFLLFGSYKYHENN